MAEYIDRSAGVSILRAKANMSVLMDAAPYFEKAAQMLEKIPAADVAPVVHGRWKQDYFFDELVTRCSACGVGFAKGHRAERFSYCPNCGAKIDGGGDD